MARIDKVLVLNLTYEILNITTFKRAIKLILKNKVEILESYQNYMRSIDKTFLKPSVLKMKYYVKKPYKGVNLTRKNILLRDNYTCQYCGKKLTPSQATIDHILPKSLGGKFTWTNLVCACSKCNSKKMNKTLKQAGLNLKRKPFKPKFLFYVRNYPHQWEKYLIGGNI